MVNNVLFPHDTIRPIQEDLVRAVADAVKREVNLLAHAPTGLGKTAASLGPALAYALAENKTVFFLTSRHTQHAIALETLKLIKEKHAKDFVVSDIIGKKHMCLQPGVQTLYTREFFEYCKHLREDGRCAFYTNTYVPGSQGNMTIRARQALNHLTVKGTSSSGDIIEMARTENEPLCPYELSQQLAKKAKVVVADYYYIFNETIRNSFMKRTDKTLADSIIIVDEGHNLPDRIRELATSRLSMNMIERALSEAKKTGYSEIQHVLVKLQDVLHAMVQEMPSSEHEQLVTQKQFTSAVTELGNYDDIVEQFTEAGDEIRTEQKRSSIASVGEFLAVWQGADEGYIRYVQRDPLKRDQIVLSYRCLDPSVITADVLRSAHSVIVMSGTLTPSSMYRDLLGFDSSAVTSEFPSPFPQKNRLNMVVPITSTKYTGRTDQQFRHIAEVCADIGNSIKGNIALFFPSYFMRDKVSAHFSTLYERTVFSEQPSMSTEEKHSLINRFKQYKVSGSALLGVTSGSFGEGIDLPGDFLKAVVVVGLPLQKPDLETKELIAYYDRKFKKGWDYGYVFPAFNKILQNAGRCIRSSTDKGVIVFLDERYAWSNYLRCFPSDLDVRVTKEYKEAIIDFFW